MGMFNSSISGALVFSMQDNQLSGTRGASCLGHHASAVGVCCTIGRAACSGAAPTLCAPAFLLSHCRGAAGFPGAAKPAAWELSLGAAARQQQLHQRQLLPVFVRQHPV